MSSDGDMDEEPPPKIVLPDMDREYYVVGKAVWFDETKCVEFKGHRSVCMEDLPPNCSKVKNEAAAAAEEEADSEAAKEAAENAKTEITLFGEKNASKAHRTRQPVSKTINAFLNSGTGGKVYLGITDDGIVRGIKLTPYQMDHVKRSLENVLTRFKPPVDPSMCDVLFSPALDSSFPPDKEFKINAYMDPNVRAMPHTLRTSRFCWCDCDAKAQLALGLIPQSYVIEISVKPWTRPERPIDWTDVDETDFIPLYETEEGKCYFRCLASNISYTTQQVYDMTTHIINGFCQDIISRLEKEINYQKLKEVALVSIRSRAKPKSNPTQPKATSSSQAEQEC